MAENSTLVEANKKRLSEDQKRKMAEGRERNRAEKKAAGQEPKKLGSKKPSRVAWIVPAHTKSQKTFEAADGETISRPTAKSNTNMLYYTLERFTFDKSSNMIKPDTISCSDHLPFRTDQCEAVKRHRFTSEDVLDILENDPGIDSMFHIRYITEEEIEKERQLSLDHKTKKLVRDRIAMIDAQNPVSRPQASKTSDSIPEIAPKMPGIPSDYYKGGTGTSIPDDSGVPSHLRGIVPDVVASN